MWSVKFSGLFSRAASRQSWASVRRCCLATAARWNSRSLRALDALTEAAFLHHNAFEELVWPSARKSASPYDFEAEVARCDIVALLVRFMRTGFKQAVDFCREHNTRVVWLPRGLGLTRIITEFHDQLVPRTTTS